MVVFLKKIKMVAMSAIKALPAMHKNAQKKYQAVLIIICTFLATCVNAK